MPEFFADGGCVSAESEGTGEPVLLLHAAVTDRRVWDPVVPGLVAAGLRAVRYDRRGYGRSARPDRPHSVVADALLVLDAAGVDSAHFVGLSQGAAIAVDVALATPDRVRSLTLVAPGMSGHRWPQLPGHQRRLAAAEAGDGHRLAVEIARLWAPQSFPAGDDFAARLVLDQAEKFMRDSLEKEEPSPVPRLGEIAVPTTIVLGADDVEEITKIGQTLADGIPGAQLTVLADCDHIVPVRQPERLVELILSSART